MTTPYRLRHGGLMRCCLETLEDAMDARPEEEGPVPVGTALHCKYCSSSMVVASDGAWEWLQTEEAK